MSLLQAIEAAGMTPPPNITPGRWMRFPGIGKSRSNRAGWCRVISPTMAIFGDWSTGLSEVWRDRAHRDDEWSRKLLEESRRREQQFAREQRMRQEVTAARAAELIKQCQYGTHPYLKRKGFPDQMGLVNVDSLIIPMRDIEQYDKILSAQIIDAAGEKRFLPGGRTKAAVYRIGKPGERHMVLCEGYATGLTLSAALRRYTSQFQVLVCFSAQNLERVARVVPKTAVVAADNDQSATGENAAIATGLRWTMPYEIGSDFNDLHQAMGLHVVTERMRLLLTGNTS